MVQPHLENSIQSWLPYLKETNSSYEGPQCGEGKMIESEFIKL